jgi:hypothetical protein
MGAYAGFDVDIPRLSTNQCLLFCYFLGALGAMVPWLRHEAITGLSLPNQRRV